MAYGRLILASVVGGDTHRDDTLAGWAGRRVPGGAVEIVPLP